MSRTATFSAICDRAIAPDAKTGTAPEWVHLFPLGKMDGRDGRKFTLSDPHNLVALFNAGGVDLPIDYEHQSDKPSAGPIPAAGWVKELRVESDGLWGRVEWTATASQMIAGKEYRYISPSFLHRKDGEVVRIKGAGLVHKPNLYLTALASEETNMTDQNQNDAALFPKIAELLNLPADTDMNTLIAALQKALSAIPDPAKYVPIEAVAEIMKDRNVQSANMSEMAVQQKVDSALRDGYITPGSGRRHFAHKTRAVLKPSFIIRGQPMPTCLSHHTWPENRHPLAIQHWWRGTWKPQYAPSLGLLPELSIREYARGCVLSVLADRAPL